MPLVTLARTDAVATVTLNRPERLNAVTADLLAELRGALEGLAADDAVRAVCLTGAGRAFCAGQDLADRDPRLHSHPFDLEAIQRDLFHPVIRLLATMPKPTVARVNGVASGAGAGLALACDISVAAASATLAFSFVKVGLSADAGVARALTRALGPARARAVLMLGQALPAPEAAAAGLIHAAVPDAALDTETADLLACLAAGPRAALLAIRGAVAAADGAGGLDEALAAEAAFQGVAGRDADYPEGVLAFLERRPPRFR